uniref:Farnesol dehydrogenase n=1 Tax=Culex pipiens TaxID=7175 RepID=A0A8D8F0E2_CULPI
MDRWQGKIAVVTGASSGIGAATAKALANAGMVVIGLARRIERVEALKADLEGSAKNRLHAAKCDVSKEEEILQTFRWIEKQFGGVDVLVNNAATFIKTKLVDTDNSEKLREIMNTNVMGLVFCTREAFQSMKARSVDGHIVHINSIAGHSTALPNMNMYCASKYAVTALTETLRQEFKQEGTKIKITSISPGAVNTEMISQAMRDSGVPLLEPVDIAEAILYAVGTPPRIQVHELTIKPVGEGR